ncbi:class I SAM-dependent methyltransferase [Metapseudomonas furukawaii]|uniref:class I SAM-dependent methyltransferase n=1 Tax=Metapseudomonas furukawaii TaxID=1149133 RepID=UPI004045795C
MKRSCPCCAHSVEGVLESPAYTRCLSCGHRWRTPPAATDAGYYESLVARNDPQAPWFARKIAERSAALSDLLAPGLRVLEVGCAEGALGQALKARLSVVYDGIELSRDRDLASQHLDRVFSTPAAGVSTLPYDLIASFHVLEHIAEPQAELLAWERLLGPAGRLLIEVPNQAGHPSLADDRNPEHLHQFTPASLSMLLARCGFACRSLTTGHYESPVYPDSIRVIAERQAQPAIQRELLLQRFRQRLGGPFIAYAIGGDFHNYVEPLAEGLELHALVDSSPAKWGQQRAGLVVEGYDPARHGDLPILICSIRFGADIRRQLLAMGIAPERLVGLEAVYEGA